MTAPPFVHLHVHSELSLVDGTLRVPELVERAREMGMPAVALTDHGNLFGLVRFYQAAVDAGIKPIIGSELWLVPEGNQPAHHLVVLARDRTGYNNLVRLVSRGYLEGQHKGQPRVAREWLREHGEGLIGLSANLEGEVGYWLARGRDEAAEEAARFYAEALPAGFYLELQRTGREGQEAVNQASLDLARRLELPVVASNNVHFADPGDVEAHEVRTAIAEGTTLERRRGPRRFTEQNHLRTPDDMAGLFEDIPEAVTNAGHIAARCTVPLEFGTPYLPDYQPPDGRAIEAYFPEAAREGLEARFPQILAREPEERHAELREQYQRRLEHEIAIIDQMGFPAYFLIVADFIQWAKDNDVPVGPGRGSGAGSLVAFALKITDIDPIRYGLLFERFLNPERVSMPDFDVDFCMEKRDRVIDYVADKYGRDKVAQIITFGAMKAKAVVRDVGRVMGHPFGYVDKIAKLVPNDLGVTLDDALKQEEDLRSRYDNEEDVHTLIEHGRRLEGLARNAGTHAGGVVISPSALTDFTPLFKEADGDTVTTQFDKDDVEEAGLVKFDFLGLRTLTVIDKAVAQVNRTRAAAGEEPLDLDALPMDDEATFELLRRCETTAVFQLESSGMKELIQRLQPSRFEDLVALVALYRPGPLESGMVDDYVERRHGRQTNWNYPHPWLEDILKETYGVILYQEQVMQIAQVLGNYSLGAADLLRRAMGKKKAKEMAKQRESFLNGARENGISEDQATYIFDLMEKFAGYGFNKCVHGDTRVMDADTGHWYRVEDLFWNGERPHVHACDEELRLVPRPVQAVVWNGVKSVYRLRTRSGWTIRATANHPFRTFDGWTRLENLSLGERIAAARRLESSTEKHWPSHELIVLAGLLGEGNTCHPANLFFYNNDSELVDDFVRAAEQFPNTSARVSCYDGVRQEVCLKRLKAVPWNSPEFEQFRVSGARWWAEQLGIVDHRATEKTVPEPVFSLANADIALFLGRLWSGDGSLNVQQTTPYYATSSPALADDVRRLLLRLGIFTVVHEKGFRYRGEIRSGYVVHLIGDDALKAFAEKVLPNVVGRQGEVEIFQRMADRGSEWTSRDTVPAQIRGRVADMRRQRGLGWAELEQRAGCSMKEFTGKGSADKRGFRRSTVEAVAQALEAPEISTWAGSDLFWDEVAEIEYVGEFDTFDLQIEEHHNFVAEGTVVHNSHSGAYALLSYRTAYLKAHYPAELMAAVLSSDMNNTDKVVNFIGDCRQMGLSVLPPDINASDLEFTVEEGAIRYGLGAIKGAGEAALDAILAERGGGGAFADLFDLARRVELRKVNKRVLEALIAAGALDGIAPGRAALYEALDTALERGGQLQQDHAVGQDSLFGEMPVADDPGTAYPEVAELDSRDRLRGEKQTLGLYLTGHPLDDRMEEITAVTGGRLRDQSPAQGDSVVVAGLVASLKEIHNRRGERMAFLGLEDPTARVEVVVFADAYEGVRDRLREEDALAVVEGRAEPDEQAGGYKVTADRILTLEEARVERARALELSVADRPAGDMQHLADLLAEHPGQCPVQIHYRIPGRARARLRMPQPVRPEPALLEALEGLLGGEAVSLRFQG